MPTVQNPSKPAASLGGSSNNNMQEAQAKQMKNLAMDSFSAYHTALKNRNYELAYTYLSEIERNRVGGYQRWVQGFRTTVSHDLIDMQVIESGSTYTVIRYRMSAVDMENGRRKYQVFTGKARLIAGTGRAIITEMDAALESSHY